MGFWHIKVDFKIESEIVNEDGSESALFGKSIDLGETIMAIGAPGKHKERPEVRTDSRIMSTTTNNNSKPVCLSLPQIQVIRTISGSNGSAISEVQLIATEANHILEIQVHFLIPINIVIANVSCII